MAHAMVDFNMYIPANAMMAVMLVALLSSNLRFATERYWIRISPWTKALIGLFLHSCVHSCRFVGNIFGGNDVIGHSRARR